MTPDDDPMPNHVLRDSLTVLEPYREQVEPLLRAAETELDE
ncbi:hypothetical protein [Streptosporangium jomthongense]|uniref:Uncharacterized protein n=1 Tax=Streptosporangium jomthongense TaxID=1193683 RepID=A0ABV8FFQ5_9ACTN